MTQEEKQLLLKDLSSRLPYGIICTDSRHGDSKITEIDIVSGLVYCYDFDEYVKIENCKPYLRPMSSMTDEERLELSMLTNDGFKFYLYTNEPIIMCSGKDYNYLNGLHILDWLNKNMFDYHNLISKGLAIAVNKK